MTDEQIMAQALAIAIGAIEYVDPHNHSQSDVRGMKLMLETLLPDDDLLASYIWTGKRVVGADYSGL